MVYKYLLVQIHSSDLYFWVGFNVLIFFKKKSFMAPFYGWDSTASRLQSHYGEAFTTKLPSILVSQKSCCHLFFISHVLMANSDMMFCAIWYYLYNFKNVKNTYGGVLLLVKFRLLPWNFTKSNTPPWVFFTLLKLHK